MNFEGWYVLPPKTCCSGGRIFVEFFQGICVALWLGSKFVMKCYQRGVRILNAAARCALWVLIAAISLGPALAEEGPAAPAPALIGNAVFPSAIDPKYVNEDPPRARLHTCVDQYNSNKSANDNGGLKWIQKGGGYWSQCSKRLGGLSPEPSASRERNHGPLEGEKTEGDSILARSATYTIKRFRSTEDNETNDGVQCLYRDQEKLLCPVADWIRFDNHYRTKGYDLLVISTGYFGTGNRWHDWKLIVDDGKHALIEPLAENCLACDIRVEKLNFQSNEVVFTHRQAKQLHTAIFRAGKFRSQMQKLNPQEPLDEETCSDLLGRYDYCTKAVRDTIDCSMAQANSGHFSLLRIEDQYAGISYDGLQQICRAACSGGEAMDSKTFTKKVCRR